MYSYLVLFQAVRFVPAERKVFTKRIALPIFRQQNSSQIRMTVKNHSKQIISFALMPVCGAPNGSHALHMHVFFIQLDLNPKAMMFCRREQVIVNFEPRLFFHSSIDAAKIGKKVETAFRPTL